MSWHKNKVPEQAWQHVPRHCTPQGVEGLKPTTISSLGIPGECMYVHTETAYKAHNLCSIFAIKHPPPLFSCPTFNIRCIVLAPPLPRLTGVKLLICLPATLSWSLCDKQDKLSPNATWELCGFRKPLLDTVRSNFKRKPFAASLGNLGNLGH